MSTSFSPRALRPATARLRAFTLIELLVVIAIISILAAILFPVFGQARERARLTSCASNVHQFMLGIMQYSADYDESMPLCVRTQDAVGPVAAAQNGVPQQGFHVVLFPYIKSYQVFQCPSDNGFIAGTGGNPKAYNVSLTDNKTKIWEAFGSSYKFNQDNFSILPSTYPASTFSATQPKVSAVKDKTSGSTYEKRLYIADGATSATSGAASVDPPFPMPTTYFARPTETAVIHDYTNPWKAPDPTKADCTNYQHRAAVIYGFADGHVKTVTSKQGEDSYCDGPTYSPSRNLPSTDPNYRKYGDGSCNTAGMERVK